MRILILLAAASVVVCFVVFGIPLIPWLSRRSEAGDSSGYHPDKTIDPSDPPPAVPEPEDDLGPGDRSVPPGSRRDREAHGKH